MRKELRNIAIIAHVDHGKTTLLDGLLRQTGALPPRQEAQTRVMDSEDLERERGITILSKITAIEFEGVRIQIFDTPGHADFGGEVERVLGMVDACLLLVDSVEGVMPQTRFVLRKALEKKLLPILVVNKMDRVEQRAEEVVDEVFDLLVELDADDAQLEFPVLYAVAKRGTAVREVGEDPKDLRPLLETILSHAPAPDAKIDGPLQFQAVTLGFDEFLGRLVIGRVARGRLARGTTVARVNAEGRPERFRVTKLFGPRGLDRVELEEAQAGDIVMIAGIDTIEVGDTICDLDHLEPLPRILIDPPTVRVRMGPNTSPFAGREGRFLTSRQIGDRLRREALSNVSIDVSFDAGPDTFEIAGRGELQIAILIETLRREGYEFGVSRPEIIERQVDGKRCEPVEDVVAEVPESFAGSVLEKMAERHGRLLSMEQRDGTTILTFVAPSRGLFGYRSEFLTDTRGDGVLHRTVRGYEPHTGELQSRTLGAIVASEAGKTTAHAIFGIQERANMFVPAGLEVYEGQVVGENRRPRDMNVNVCRGKKLTNVRAAGKDDAAVLTPPRLITIENALEWIADDELLEVTPKSLRLRKRKLAANLRKRG
ncbi:MAG: translational GTPase TypA [Deltaproteobacteria bacterium]|nr:translational GTPase TypA [Deltaproteobacteria bacterium]MBW2415691.1 translational GTPase TypA [Deltaproteobacteria bacterium]